MNVWPAMKIYYFVFASIAFRGPNDQTLAQTKNGDGTIQKGVREVLPNGRLSAPMDITAPEDMRETFTASFQEDGYYSAESYAKQSYPLVQDLWNFTLCFRMKIFHHRPKTYVMSYATSDNGVLRDNELIISMNSRKKNIKFAKREGKIKIRVEIETKYQIWVYVCYVYNYGKQLDVYIDGKLAGSTKINALAETRPVRGNGTWVLAQEQDAIGELFDKTQSFAGQLAQVNLWSSLLDNVTINMAANCLFSGPVNQMGNVIAWKKDQWKFSNSSLVTISTAEFCKQSVLNYVPFLQLRSYNFYKRTCTALGGVIPTHNSQGSYQEFYHFTKKLFNREVGDKNKMSISTSRCFFRGNEVRFWMGRNRHVESGKWYNPYDRHNGTFLEFEGAWYGDEPSESTHQCAHAWTTNPKDKIIKNWSSANCGDRDSCAVCKTNPKKKIGLGGLCMAQYNEQVFDTHYYIHGQKNDKIYFKGYLASHIYYDSQGQWRVESYADPSKYAYISAKDSKDQYPMGRQIWIISKGICEKENEPIELVLSTCDSTEFTCNDGQCVDMDVKCDLNNDCVDKSDEAFCDNLIIPEGYRASQAPRDDNGATLELKANVSIAAFPNVITSSQQFVADLYLSLRWRDNRLIFTNLNNVTNLNTVGTDDMNAMWIPKVNFKNAIGAQNTENDDKTTLLIERENKPLSQPLSQSREAEMFPGVENHIFMRREYYQNYECKFQLKNFPFDRQYCDLTFQINGVTEKYWKFAKDFEGVEYTGETFLTEFEVEDYSYEEEAAPEAERSSSFSKFHISIVFRRRSEYHVSNIYLQTALLLITACLTLFFDVTNFSDRIMVALTVMLVVATLQTNIQSTLPPTAYFKLIDYWLIFSFNAIIGIMLAHTVLAYRIKKEGEAIEKEEQDNQLNHRVKAHKISPSLAPTDGGQVHVTRPMSALSIISSRGNLLSDKDFPKTRRLNFILRCVVLAAIVTFVFFYVIYVLIIM